MNRFLLPGGTLRRSRLGVLLPVVGVIAAGLLLLGQPGIMAISNEELADEETARQFFRVLGETRMGGIEAFFTGDAVLHTPEGVFEGPAGAERFAESLTDVFPRVSFTIRQLEIADDTVTVLWSVNGVQYGDYHGQPASCAGVAVEGVAVMRFEDHLIAGQTISYDRLSILRQIEAFNRIDANSRPGCPNR